MKNTKKKVAKAQSEKNNHNNFLASFIHKLSETAFDKVPKNPATYYYDESNTSPPAATPDPKTNNASASLKIKGKDLFLVAVCELDVLVVKVQRNPIHEHFRLESGTTLSDSSDSEINQPFSLPSASFFFYLAGLYKEAVETFTLSPFHEQWGQKAEATDPSANLLGRFWKWLTNSTSPKTIGDFPVKTIKMENSVPSVDEIKENSFRLQFDKDFDCPDENTLKKRLKTPNYVCCSGVVVHKPGSLEQHTQFLFRDSDSSSSWYSFKWTWEKLPTDVSGELKFSKDAEARQVTLLISNECDPASAFHQNTKEFLAKMSKDMFSKELLFTSPKIHFGLMTTSPAHVIAVPELRPDHRLIGGYMDVNNTTYNEVIFKAVGKEDREKPNIVSQGLTTFPYLFEPTCSFVGCVIFNASKTPKLRMIRVTEKDGDGMQKILEDSKEVAPDDYKKVFLKGQLESSDEWIIQFYKTEAGNHLVFRLNVFLTSQKGFVP